MSFILALIPAFWPKTATEVALTSDIKLSAFYPEPTSPLERQFHLICHIRALRIYLRCVTRSRGPNRSLFVHWDEAKMHRPVSKQWISAALSEVIHHAYCQARRCLCQPSFYSERGSFLGRNCQSVGFGNLPCNYLVVLVYVCQTLSCYCCCCY